MKLIYQNVFNLDIKQIWVMIYASQNSWLLKMHEIDCT